MSGFQVPINPPWGPTREPAVGPAVTSVSSPADHCQPFDFRCARFDDDARTLVRATGRTLDQCRQELFIAEGDLALAYELLTVGYGATYSTPILH